MARERERERSLGRRVLAAFDAAVGGINFVVDKVVVPPLLRVDVALSVRHSATFPSRRNPAYAGENLPARDLALIGALLRDMPERYYETPGSAAFLPYNLLVQEALKMRTHNRALKTDEKHSDDIVAQRLVATARYLQKPETFARIEGKKALWARVSVLAAGTPLARFLPRVEREPREGTYSTRREVDYFLGQNTHLTPDTRDQKGVPIVRALDRIAMETAGDRGPLAFEEGVQRYLLDNGLWREPERGAVPAEA